MSQPNDHQRPAPSPQPPTLHTGIDLIEIERIERAIGRWGERFLRRVFTPAELAAYRGRLPSLAARWAGKEATAKLLGVGLRGLGGAGRRPSADAVGWTEIEILSDASGRPTVTLSGQAAQRARAMGLGCLSLSLSHTRLHAIASAAALGAEGFTPV
ncbi:MAG TPA: holo-ACP synthase [Roseiflexaceae bacterium]|nr:holo-ACP synthase [Roseiflexaceae bacterium]